MCTVLRSVARAEPAMSASRVIYGGSAGDWLLTEPGGAADGLFLGRASPDPAVLEAVLDEATALAAR